MKDRATFIITVIVFSCLIISLLTLCIFADSNTPTTSARAACLYEPVTDTFIYSKNMNERLPMASTTKIMTGLLAIENLELDKEITVPKEASGIEGSSIYLEEGDVLTVKDLIYSLLLQSANDAATALAYAVSGDIHSFAELMNERATELKLSDTHFTNPHGLDDEEHYTTAHDLAILAATALKNPIFRKITSTYKYSFFISDKSRVVVNHNKLLKGYEGATGVKTGFTKKSGRCLVSSAKRSDLELVAVTLDDPCDWQDHKNMLDYGFDSYEAITLDSLVDIPDRIPVIEGKSDFVNIELSNISDNIFVKKKGTPDLSATLTLDQYIIAPSTDGQKVGEVVIKLGDTEYKRFDIVTKESIDKKNNSFNIFDIFKF